MKMRFRRRRRAIHINKFIVIILILSVLSFVSMTVYSNVHNVFKSAAVSNLQKQSVMTINNSVSKKISDDKVTYEDLTNITKDSNEKVTAVTINSANVNKIKADLTVDILNDLNKLNIIEIQVPLGNFFRSEFLSGVGPKLEFKVVPCTTVNVNIRDQFTDAGINQTWHAIYLDISTQISALMPGSNITADVSTSILITQTLIIGDVPESYANITEAPGEARGNVFDVIR